MYLKVPEDEDDSLTFGYVTSSAPGLKENGTVDRELFDSPCENGWCIVGGHDDKVSGVDYFD